MLGSSPLAAGAEVERRFHLQVILPPIVYQHPMLSAFLMTCYWLNGLWPALSLHTGPLWHATFSQRNPVG